MGFAWKILKNEYVFLDKFLDMGTFFQNIHP